MGNRRCGDRDGWGCRWAWVVGLALGLTFGLLLFDNWIIGVLFGVSIGATFALAVGQSAKKRG